MDTFNRNQFYRIKFIEPSYDDDGLYCIKTFFEKTKDLTSTFFAILNECCEVIFFVISILVNIMLNILFYL